MPEFYLVPKGLVRRLPWLTRLIHRIEAAVFYTVFWLIRRLSLERALGVSGALFYLAGRLSDKRRKADTNLAIAFPEKDAAWRRRTTREIFRHLGYSMVELIKLDQIWAEKERRIEFVLEDGARAHMERGGPTLFMTAHVGPWQVAPLITREYAFTINTVYAPESNPVMNEVMRELRESLGERLIPADAGPRPIMRELEAGRSIAVAMDTRPDTGKLIPFFGRDALTNTSAAGLALRAGATLMVVRAERLGRGRYRITACDPIASPDRQRPLKEQAVAMTERVYAHFEQWIRENPEQWICLKRRWPKEHRL